MARTTRRVGRTGRKTIRPRAPKAGNRALIEDQLDGSHILHHIDRRRCANRADQSIKDDPTGAVALRMHDPPSPVRRLQAQREIAIGVAVERHAQPLKPFDASGGGAGDRKRRARLAQAGAGRERVGGVQFRCIVRTKRGREASLRPGGRGLHAKPRLRDQRDRQVRKMQRRCKAGDAGAYHDHAITRIRRNSQSALLNALRACARRRRALAAPAPCRC